MADSGTRTVDRALLLLSHVCSAGKLTLSEAARAADLSPSTALRLLRTMEARGFLRKDEDSAYRPGLRLVQVGAQALSSDSLVTLTAPALRHLVEETGESSYLAVPHLQGTEKEHCIYLAMEEGTHSVRHTSWVGRSFPLRGSAAGAALTGQVPEGQSAVVQQAVEADVTAIAAPIRTRAAGGGQPKIVASLSVVAPTYRMTENRISQISALVAREAATVLELAETYDAESKETTP